MSSQPARTNRNLITVAAALLLLAAATPAFGQPRKAALGAAPFVPASSDEDRPRIKHEPGTLEIRFNDGGALFLKLKDENIEIATPYGSLRIPVKDVEKIDVGLRIPEELAKKIEQAVANLGSSNFRAREAAGVELLGYKEKAYHAVLRASKHTDAEVSHRAEELLAKIRENVPEELLNIPENDVVHTKDSKIAGKIAATTIRVHTAQFGEQQVRLADVVSLRSPTAPEPRGDAKNVMNDPGSLGAFQAMIGQTFSFRVTGALGGSVWGTDFYTLDTSLATAAVHCGLVQPGKTGIVRVTILPPQAAFQGSTRNGVTSSAYGNYPGAYRVHK